jgi:hypothetical protein
MSDTAPDQVVQESRVFNKVPDGAPHPKEFLHHWNEDEVEVEEIEPYFDRDICLSELDRLARGAIKAFFDGKEMSYGGEIPDHILLTDERVSMVLNTNFEAGPERAFAAIKRSGVRPEWIKETYNKYDDGEDDETEPAVRLYSKCVQEASGFWHRDPELRYGSARIFPMKKISRCFVPGLVLMCLELCYGISID